MKIGILISDITKVGGIERVTSTLIGEFCKYKNIEVDIISLFKGRDKPAYPIPDNVRIHYIMDSSHGNKPHSFKRLINMFSRINLLNKFFKNHDYDILVAQSFPPALLTFISNFDSKKVVAVEHVYAGYYNFIVNTIRDFIYKRMAKIVVLTKNDKQFFSKHGLSEKTIVIPNPFLSNDISKASCENKRIISVGRLVYQKGYNNLITAFKTIHENFCDWKLDIFGDGPLKQELSDLIKKNNLDNVVTLRGISNDIPKELSESSIFVLSSHFEGFPMVLVEAMYQGVPCVSYDCPNGPSDIVKTGVNGILVQDQDINKLIKGMSDLIIDDVKRKKMGENAPLTVANFSKEFISQNWIKLFNDLYSEYEK